MNVASPPPTCTLPPNAPVAHLCPPRSPNIRTLAFLFADIRGYTSYLDEHGDAAGAELVGAYRHIVRAAIASHDGTEVGTEGDSFFVTFESVSSAVHCGVAILAATGAHDPPIRAGVGINAGEASAGDSGYVATPVNIASRLCAAAQAGDLLVSETVRYLTRSAVPQKFQSAGAKRLKGVEEPVQTWKIEVPGAARMPTYDRPPRRFVVAAMIALAVAALNEVLQAYFVITDATVLGQPYHAVLPQSVGTLVAWAGLAFLTADLVAVAAALAGSASASRLITRTVVAAAILDSLLIPVFIYRVSQFGNSLFSDGFLAAFGALSIGAFAGMAYGLVKRRVWAVGLGYVACGIFALYVTTLPLAILGWWALRRRRENALY